MHEECGRQKTEKEKGSDFEVVVWVNVKRHRCAHRRPGRLQNRRRLRARYEGYLEILNRNYCACAGAGFQ